ncbi:MAG: hypothetical protein LUH07_13355 [Lachnospiraceae bacterium]|nr:hypothetical protein [Lachnospiraceae bacterium]
MKKKLILGICTLSAAAMLCGFDSAETADSILEKVTENTASIESMTSDIGFNCDVAVNVGDGTTTSSIAVLITADFDMQATLDPVAFMMDGGLTMSTFGQSEDITLKMYAINNDDTLDTYVYTEDSAYDEEGEGTWEYDSSDDFDIQSLLEYSETLNIGDLSDWGITFELASEAADYEGTECYLLTSVIDTTTLTTVLEKAEELAGEELTDDDDISTALALLDGLKLSIEYYIDTTSYLPVAMHMDLNDSDLSVLNSYIGEMMLDLSEEDDSTTVELILNDVSLDFTFSYDDIVSITVPEEALAAADEEDESEYEDITDESGIQFVEG